VRTELTALVAAGEAAAEIVVGDGLVGVATAFERVELFDELEVVVWWLVAPDTVCRPRAFPAVRLRAVDLPAAWRFAPGFEQLVIVIALALSGAGSCFLGDPFFGGHVGVVVPAGGAEG
jgi:hypothetical protein